jgi:DNA polymerase-3 subunit gamma/tau
MRDAQSALDQVISFAGTKIKKEDVEMALGVAGADILTRVMDSIAANDPAAAITVVDDIVMRGHDLRNFCRDLLAHFRDLLVTKVSGNEELLESAVCDLAELKRQAALFSESDLVRFFHSLSETETKLRAATQPRYQLEVGIVKLMELRGVESIAEILQRVVALESGAGSSSFQSGSGSVSSKAPSRVAGSSFVAATAVAPALEKSDPESLIDRVKSVLESQKKMLLVTALDAAEASVLENGELSVQFAPQSRYQHDKLSENTKFLADACREVTGQQTRVRIYVKDPRAENQPLSKEDEERLEKQRLRELAESSPAVQQALKTFRGQIVDVRRADTD